MKEAISILLGPGNISLSLHHPLLPWRNNSVHYIPLVFDYFIYMKSPNNDSRHGYDIVITNASHVNDILLFYPHDCEVNDHLMVVTMVTTVLFSTRGWRVRYKLTHRLGEMLPGPRRMEISSSTLISRPSFYFEYKPVLNYAFVIF